MLGLRQPWYSARCGARRHWSPAMAAIGAVDVGGVGAARLETRASWARLAAAGVDGAAGARLVAFRGFPGQGELTGGSVDKTTRGPAAAAWMALGTGFYLGRARVRPGGRGWWRRRLLFFFCFRFFVGYGPAPFPATWFASALLYLAHSGHQFRAGAGRGLAGVHGCDPSALAEDLHNLGRRRCAARGYHLSSRHRGTGRRARRRQRATNSPPVNPGDWSLGRTDITGLRASILGNPQMLMASGRDGGDASFHPSF